MRWLKSSPPSMRFLQIAASLMLQHYGMMSVFQIFFGRARNNISKSTMLLFSKCCEDVVNLLVVLAAETHCSSWLALGSALAPQGHCHYFCCFSCDKKAGDVQRLSVRSTSAQLATLSSKADRTRQGEQCPGQKLPRSRSGSHS